MNALLPQAFYPFFLQQFSHPHNILITLMSPQHPSYFIQQQKNQLDFLHNNHYLSSQINNNVPKKGRIANFLCIT